MKKKVVSMLLGVCLVVPVVSFGAGQAEKKAKPLSFKEQLSYSMGFEVGNYFKGAGEDIRKDLLLKGIADAYDGKKPLLTREQMVAVQKKFAKEMEGRQKEKLAAMLEKNKKEGAAYLEKNSSKEGVIVTKSGLQYEVLTQGKGKKPKAGDRVKVDYVGKLINGREFDNSKKRGEPVVFEVGQVIKGWSEALQLMNVGSKYRLVIPSELAYGERGVAPLIQPNSVLVFEVELLGIEK